MRTIWTAISVVCFLNVVALVALAAWLVQTGRVDAQRVREVRAMFAETVGERDARIAGERDAAGEQASVGRAPGDPLSAEGQLVVRMAGVSADEERLQRLRREVNDLQASVSRQRRLLDQERQEFEQRAARFEAERAEIQRIDGDEQFAKSLVVLEGLKPEEAASTLRELLGADRRFEVIAYLDAMDERARTKVFSEFIKDGDTALAAELLESLRVRGIGDLALGATGP